MYVEVSVAVNYVLSHLYTKLPRRRVDNFGEELERCLLRKLQPLWFAEPPQDTGHRCFQTSGPLTDLVFPEAAISSGLEWTEIQACLPAGLVLQIDPGHVACQYGSSEPSPNVATSPWNNGTSTSLSSSGCSSASSVSSSGSWTKTKHQVLYSANSRSASGDKDGETMSGDVSKKQLDEVQTHLATEAALSVLTEPEDVISTTQKGQESSKPRRSVESPGSVGDSQENAESKSNSSVGVKTTDSSGDAGFFEQSSNVESQAKSDIENQFPLGDFNTKVVRNTEDLSGDLQPFEFHTGPQNQPSFPQASTTFIQKPTITPSFTAATFAATKFGSTKLKNQAKRPHRLVSPCEAPNSAYNSQLMDALGPNSLQTSQTPLCDRLLRLNELHRNGGGLYGNHNFGFDSSRNGFYGNLQPVDRSNDLVFNIGNYSNGFLDNAPGMGLYGNPETSLGGFGMRSSNLVNNPMWSQFEKIRTEFQLKNSQYLQQQQVLSHQETATSLNRGSNFGFNSLDVNSGSVRGGSGFSAAPRSALQQQPSETKYGLIDDLGLSQDLHDLWTSQKMGSSNGASNGNTTSNNTNSFWANDVGKTSGESNLGQAFSALNISER